MTDLKSLVQKAVQKNLPQLGTIRESCTYHSYAGDGSYSATPGTITRGTKTDYPGIKIVVGGFTFTQIRAGDYFPEDTTEQYNLKKCLIAALDLAVPVKNNDELTITSSGIKYLINGVKTDPANATWTFRMTPIDRIELVENGTFDTDTTSWNPTSTAVLSVDTERLKVTSITPYDAALQSIVTVPGQLYSITLNLVSMTSATGELLLENEDTSVILNKSLSTGMHTFAFEATGNSVKIVLITVDSSSNTIWDNISVKAI